MPCMMASSGRWGVDSSLKISILPARTTTKSVNVPPVSTPIRANLVVEPRDILDEPRRNGFEVLNRAHRVAFPDQGLKIGARYVEPMNGHFASTREVGVRQRRCSERFDPLENLSAFVIGTLNLQVGTLSRVDANRNVTLPAGFDEFQVENGFQNKEDREIATRNFASRNAALTAGIASEHAPQLASTIQRRRRRQDKNPVGAILLKSFQIIRGKVARETNHRSV